MVGLAETKLLVIPDRFGRSDYTEMVKKLLSKWPSLEHVYVIGKKYRRK
ncbi:hypothetical protein [Thermoactinomyces mirandus]|nr:hypothetical protein [Thermoactinomyces mirandus]